MEVTKSNQTNMMARFGVLLGDWALKYKVPKSRFSEAATGTGTGIFRRTLNDKYVYFDYSCSLTTGDSEAHGIFAWDQKAKVYRYWCFEDSGDFSEAAGDFIDDQTLPVMTTRPHESAALASPVDHSPDRPTSWMVRSPSFLSFSVSFRRRELAIWSASLRTGSASVLSALSLSITS